MAGDAHLRASLTLSTNLEDAVKEASKGLSNVEGQVAKSQDRLKKIIEKGDPFFALKRQQEKELAEVEKHIAKDARLRELGEISKTKILEKYAKRREDIEERTNAAIQKAALRSRDVAGNLEQKFNAARGVMDAFGASSNTAIGQATAGLADLAQGFAVGGAAGLAVTGLTTLVYKLGSAWSNAASSAMQAKIAITTEWQDANAAVKAMIEAGKDDVLRRRARLAGVSDDEIRGQDVLSAATAQFDARNSNIASIQGRIDANNAAMAPLLAQIDALSDNPTKGTPADIANIQTKIDPLAQAIAADTALLKDAREFLTAAEKNLGEARLLKEQLVGTGGAEEAKRLADAAARKRTSTKTSGELPNVYSLLSDGMFDSAPGGGLPVIDEEYLDAATNRRVESEESAASAAFDKVQQEAAKLRAAQRAAADALEKTNQDKADAAVDAWAAAGVSAAGQFASGFAKFLDSRDPKDLFGGLLSAAGGILGMLGGVNGALGIGGTLGGGFLGILGGFFERGGVPYGLHLPQGRNGLATMPGLNYDARPAWLHPGEVVMPERVVNGTFGGLPNAARVAAGGPLPGGGGGSVSIVQNVMAFDAPTIERNSSRVEGVQSRRVTNRQAAGWQEAVRHAVMAPRYA